MVYVGSAAVNTEYAVLLVEDNAGDADYLQRVLTRSETNRFEVTVVSCLNSAITVAGARPFDAVLLDLSLPDSQGLDTVTGFLAAAPQLPVIVMTGYDDMQTGVVAVRYGAQDYVIKGEVIAKVLERAIVHAIERKRADLVGKQLLRASIGVLSGGSATRGMTAEHAAKLAEFVQELRAYMTKNAPAHVENVETIVGKHQVDVALREIRDIVGGGLPRRASELATRMIDRMGRATPVPPDSAKGALLDVIESSEEIGKHWSGNE